MSVRTVAQVVTTSLIDITDNSFIHVLASQLKTIAILLCPTFGIILVGLRAELDTLILHHCALYS